MTCFPVRLDSRAERLIQLIGENAERSLRMIEDLRSGTKEISLQRASTNLTQLIAKTAEEVKMPDACTLRDLVYESQSHIIASTMPCTVFG